MISKKFIADHLISSTATRSAAERSSLATDISEFLDSYIEAANMAVLALDADRKIVMINSLSSSLFEMSENNLIDEYIEEVLPNSPLTGVTLQNYKSIPKEFLLCGKRLYSERTLITHDDAPIALISFFQDITDSEETNQRLNQSRKQEIFLNDIIENSYDGIYITDREGKTIMVNKAYERISGISRDMLVGEYMSNLVAAGILSTSLTEEVVSQKKTVTRTQRNLNDKEVIITGNPVFDQKGQVRHVITNVRDITELVSLNNRLLAESHRANLYQEQLFHESSDENIVYGSREFENVLNIASKVSKMDSTVLILGETGTGKEIVAQYIHKHSARSAKPYIKINCGAIPENLLESELFGYVPGAFTGASAKGKPGLFELADTGTLFLDEIGELPLSLQSALLRILQDGEVTRVGGSKSKKVDVRIIAATNRNLESMIAEGTFRSDLYYRLNVVSVAIPPLRERKADIPFLADKTLADLNGKYGVSKALSPDFIQTLMEMDWPGNIRELKNFIEKQFVLSDGNIIGIVNLPQSGGGGSDSHEYEDSDSIPTYAEAKDRMERELFRRAMLKGKSTYKAASILGMSQPTFFRKYKELFPDGIEEPS
ncbi:MAG TPA: sigma 54-interacting transcriptional regulator [Candidatus Copromorpha excrementigallinarum]|uniref:Sigma 54-interacting transcriptional regulator n=1 Tax=Candidatus Allocopromorpha excrementigallinarum TaxID=2840742 RepID=A0A9D1HZ98_9FIRM|nr:sigma 54-interacting transcriptional regulator [Candidatus Copromorpha excrementigallinarum]